MKKTVSFILSLIMLMALIAPVMVSAEDVVLSQWSEADVNRALKLHWVEKDDFTQNIKRGEFCLIAEKMLLSSGLNVNFFSMETPFTDIGEGYSGQTGAIKYLYCLGIIKGCSENLFCPDNYITREEAAVIFSRMTDAFRTWEVADMNNTGVEDWAYSDHGDISSWATDSVYAVSNLGIMKGSTTGFEPKANLTKEQAIAMLLRLYDARWENEPANFADKLNFLIPKEENYMFSPLSIKVAFGLLANGANEEAKEEILTALGIEDLEVFNFYVDEMMKEYNESQAIDINIANSVWLNKELTKNEFDGDFEYIATEYYASDVGKVVNSNGVDTINEWVADKTEGKIDRVISSVDFTAALINATYFKGTWLKAFDDKDTYPDIFHNQDNSETETDFMTRKSFFNYCETASSKIIELPYKSDSFNLPGEDKKTRLDISMYLLLSDEDINVINELDMAKNNFIGEMVELTMPKFEITYSMDLTEYLEPLGMEKIFADGLTNIVENENMSVNKALHKTYINVNEKDTEAAAVTVIGVATSAKPQEEKEVIKLKLDKPFYFAVRDNLTGEVLFMGKYLSAE